MLTSIENNYAKWPKSFGSAIFLDSSYLYTSLVSMVISNAEKLIARQYNNSNEVSNYLDLGRMVLAAREIMNERTIKISEYAMMVHLQVKDRFNKYIDGEGADVKETIKDIYNSKALLDTSTGTLSILDSIGSMKDGQPIMVNFFVLIIFFMVLLSIIVNQSLV